MKKVQNFSPVKTAHSLLLPHIKKAKLLMDATCGTGKDSLFLAENSPADAMVVAFDIQMSALEQAKVLLQAVGLEHKVRLVADSYVSFQQYCPIPDVILFNLGYLPGGDKGITTHVEDLAVMLPELLECLNPGGVVCVVSYPGHSEGAREWQWLESYLQQLSSKLYNVGKFLLFNHNKVTPLVYIIEKL